MWHALQYSVPSGYAYIAEQVRAEPHTDESSPRLKHKVDHLTCFVPGMLALGAVNAAGVDWKDTAEKFMEMRLNGKLSTMVLAALAEEEKAVAKTTAESSADVSTAGETSESEEVDVPAAAGAVPTFVTPPAAKPNTYTVMKSRDSAFTAGISKSCACFVRCFALHLACVCR